MNKCKTCGKNAEEQYCFRHKPKKKLPARKVKSAATTKEILDEVRKENEIMRDFFLKIWKKRLHYSQVSMDYLGKEPLSVFFHHILSKEKYPQACFDEENIVLLTIEEHDGVEKDMYKYPEINRRRELLKIKYNL